MAKKKIKILTKGVITVKGYISGPVLTPYYEDISTIGDLLRSGINVVEVLSDGREVKLTIQNFEDEIDKPVEKPVEEKPVIETPVEAAPEVPEVPVIDTPEDLVPADEVVTEAPVVTEDAVEEFIVENDQEDIDTGKNYKNHKKNRR